VENRTEKTHDDDAGTFGLYCLIAREAIQNSEQQDHDDSIGNIAAHFKGLCATRRLAYDSDIAAKAIEASLVGHAARRA
jgi:hypothetical protein